MSVLAINGSPRKEWNTATLLNKTLEGAASQGQEIELIHLYDLDFRGCKSCFACKKRGGKSYGRCAAKDSLTPVLEKVQEANALILGSPLYFGSVTGEMKSFIERLLFPYLTYTDPPGTLFPRKIKTGFIYTMNATEQIMQVLGWDKQLEFCRHMLIMIFGHSEPLFCFDTYQFKDYSKVVADRFNPEEKARQRREVFPLDCKKAFDMGVRFAKA
ncbi:flavodoxin family protein [Chloroflexota bacterium]